MELEIIREKRTEIGSKVTTETTTRKFSFTDDDLRQTEWINHFEVWLNGHLLHAPLMRKEKTDDHREEAHSGSGNGEPTPNQGAASEREA